MKILISLDERLLAKVDLLIRRKVYPSRSRVIQEAIAEKLARLKRLRLARECAKLDPKLEQRLADEALR